MRDDNEPRQGLWCQILLATGILCLAGAPVHANPTAPTVVSGQVGFSASGNALTVTNSPGSVINWHSFSIGNNELTRFIQQSSASAVLNRVTGLNPSAILGALQSNGRVFLINPNGITFGPNSQIDVAGLVASTLNLSDSDFLAGRFRFTETPGAGSIVNQGSLTTATGGMVYLVAPDIQNSGIIRTPQGEILLAAGKSIELVDAQTPEMRVQITALDNQALNLGQLIAQGGRIGMYAGLIRQGGVANANTAVMGENGKIVFKAVRDVTLEAGSQTVASGPQGGSITVQSETGTTLVAGNIEAKGESGRGGNVQILGNKVGLIDHATVDASGQTGGGTVLVGGDFQGKNPDVQNSWRTYFGPNTSVKADAIAFGDGGKVIVWADDWTKFYGSISVRGGAQGGNGGFVEVSGKGSLVYVGTVNTPAPNGNPGTLLLDPTDIHVVATGENTTDLATVDQFADVDLGASQTAILNTALEANTNVILQASQDIFFDAAVNNPNVGRSITAQAGRNITVGAPITTNAGAIRLEADSPHSGAADGTGSLTINQALSSTGGAITLIGADFSIGANVDAAAGGINFARSVDNTAITIGSGIVNNTELDFLRTTGALGLGRAITGGSDGAGTSTQTLTASSITVDTATIIASASGGSLQLLANNGVTLSASLTTNQATTINADVDASGAGTFAVAGTKSLNTSGNTLQITADDIDISGTISSGASTTTIIDSDGTGIGVGTASIVSGLNVSNAELTNVTSSGLTLQTNGSITVNGVTGAATTNTGAMTLTPGGAGTVTIGTADTDSSVFTGGVIATGGTGKSIAGTISAAGTGVIDLGTTGVSVTADATVGGTSTGQITLGATTLADGVTLTLGAGAASPVSVTSVTGTALNAVSNLTINVKDDASNPAVSIGNVGTDIGTVTVTQSSGTTFTGTVDAATVTLSDTKTGRDIAFQGNLTAGTLNTAAQGYNVALTGGSNTITNAVTFSNTGTLTLGQASGTQTYNGGITATAPSGTTLNGTIATSSDALTFGPVTIGADTTLNAGSANVTFASTVNGPAGLTVNSTGATTFSATVGGVTPLASLATNAGGTTSLQDVTTTGAQSYSDNVVLKSIYTTGNGAFSVGGTTAFSVASTAINTGGGDITFTGTIDGANNLTLTNTGTTTFVSSVGGITPLATFTATSGNFVMPASVTTAGDITVTGAGNYSVPSVTTTGSGNISLASTGGTLSVNAAKAAAGRNVTFTADEIELTGAAGSIMGSANLRIQPQTVSQAAEIGGAGGTSALDITNSEITKIATGFQNITIGQTAGTGAVSFNTASFNDHVTVIGGSIAANGTLTSAGKTVTLIANTGGISSGTGTGVNVVANTLNANAAGNITLNTRVDTINATSSAGSIALVEDDNATLANVSAPAGDVDITSTTGNLTLGTITAGTSNNKFALLFAPAGAILDGNGSGVNVTAANIELVARDGIDLDTMAFNSDINTVNYPALQASRINSGTITAVNIGIADIDIRQAGNADILNVATASDLDASGNITISGTTNLSVNTVTAGGLIYFGSAPAITTRSVGGNMLITLNSPRASSGLSDPVVTLSGGGVVAVVNDTGNNGGPGKVAVIERFVAPSGAVDYQVTGSGTGDNRFTLMVAGQVPALGGNIQITAPGAITDYTGTPPDTSDVINVLNLVGQTIQVSGFTSSLAYQLVTEGGGLEGFTPEQTIPASVAQLVQQIASSQRSTQSKEEKKRQDAVGGRMCR